MTQYSTHDVEVVGGTVRVAVWEPADRGSDVMSSIPTVVAVHGVTASHRCWLHLADALPEARIIAPDLRGRGQSNQATGPFGMAAHADDLAAILGQFNVDDAVLVGHSMGGFVALVTADRYPDMVGSLVLIDGGLPLPALQGPDTEAALAATLGMAAERLGVTFPDRENYREFWAQHPAFGADWSDAVTDYFDYDLQGEEPELRPSADYDAVAADSRDIATGDALPGAIDRIRHPVDLLLAPRGMLNEVPPLYPEEYVDSWQERLPTLRVSRVDAVNHYTIVMSERGAAAVAEAIRSTLS